MSGRQTQPSSCPTSFTFWFHKYLESPSNPLHINHFTDGNYIKYKRLTNLLIDSKLYLWSHIILIIKVVFIYLLKVQQSLLGVNWMSDAVVTGSKKAIKAGDAHEMLHKTTHCRKSGCSRGVITVEIYWELQTINI